MNRNKKNKKVEFKTLENTSLQTILEAFNLGFSDYSIPLKLNLKQLEQKIIIENIILEISVGAFMNEKLVGFILHGIKFRDNSTIAYNGGTAVEPTNRGQQLTKKMYQFIMPILKSKNIMQVYLEVIESNLPALSTYEAVGFSKTRRLISFEGNNDMLQSSIFFNIKPMKEMDWNTMVSFWDIIPSWQNDIEAVKSTVQNAIAIKAEKNNEMIGYLIYRPNNFKIVQIAVHKDYRNQYVAQSLLYYISKENANNMIITNIEEQENGSVNWFYKMGFQKFLVQLEMKLTIPN